MTPVAAGLATGHFTSARSLDALYDDRLARLAQLGRLDDAARAGDRGGFSGHCDRDWCGAAPMIRIVTVALAAVSTIAGGEYLLHPDFVVDRTVVGGVYVLLGGLALLAAIVLAAAYSDRSC